jgi:hypothetical protein
MVASSLVNEVVRALGGESEGQNQTDHGEYQSDSKRKIRAQVLDRENKTPEVPLQLSVDRTSHSGHGTTDLEVS